MTRSSRASAGLADAARTERWLLVLGVLFIMLGAAALMLNGRSATVLASAAVLGACATVAHAWLNRVAPGRNPLLLPAALLLTGWGLLTVARVAPNFLLRQTAWLVVGALALCAIAASRDQLRWLRRFRYTWLALGLALLAISLVLGVNPAGTGARLWLNVGGLYLQPAEILRLLIIAYLAAYFSERLGEPGWLPRALPAARRDALSERIRPLAPAIAMWLVAAALLVTQQDLGAATLLMITFGFLLYLATGQGWLPLAGIAAFAAVGLAGFLASARVAQRIAIWLNPWIDPQGASFQIVQSLIAVASGGLIGQGLGQGRPDYVPAVHTDFPFAAIGEEFGLLGALAVIAALGLLAVQAWRIARQSQAAYPLLLAGGLAAALTVQTFVIVGGNLGIVPLTGVTLPFVSYGGSSLLVSFIEVGLLVRISADHGAAQSAFLATPAQHAAARRASRISLALFVILGAATAYWVLAQGGALTARDDNPRRVDAERGIARGPILARDGTLLAYSTAGARASDLGAVTPYERAYPRPEAAPVVGYYSWRHGAGGIEARADAILRGRLTDLDRLLHRTQVGLPYTTTLDAALQARAADALSGATGAAIVLDWRTGEVLALASAPSYDPNRLDERWDDLRSDRSAPLVNRATQGLYQPGGLLAWLGLDAGNWAPRDPLGLGRAVPFELDNAAVPFPATPTYSETIGQGALRVTPLRIAATAASLTAGRPVTPTLAAGAFAQAESDAVPLRVLDFPALVFAEIGPAKHVGWLVDLDGGRVIVVALEQAAPDAAPDAARLRAAGVALRAAP